MLAALMHVDPREVVLMRLHQLYLGTYLHSMQLANTTNVMVRKLLAHIL